MPGTAGTWSTIILFVEASEHHGGFRSIGQELETGWIGMKDEIVKGVIEIPALLSKDINRSDVALQQARGVDGQIPQEFDAGKV
jgi:hypothetical protein